MPVWSTRREPRPEPNPASAEIHRPVRARTEPNSTAEFHRLNWPEEPVTNRAEELEEADSQPQPWMRLVGVFVLSIVGYAFWSSQQHSVPHNSKWSDAPYHVPITDAMLSDVEMAIPSVALRLDVSRCIEILDQWNDTAVILTNLENAQVSQDVAHAAFVVNSQQVLPGLDRWTFIVRCAMQKNELQPNPDQDMDCDNAIVNATAVQFLNNVKATRTGLCSPILQLSGCHVHANDPAMLLGSATATIRPEGQASLGGSTQMLAAERSNLPVAEHAYQVSLNQSVFQELEIAIPAAALTLDEQQCSEIQNTWNSVASVLAEVETAQISHAAANAAFRLTSQHVLPGLDRWSLVVQCAIQKNEIQPNPDDDVDCDNILVSMIATQFLNDVKATQSGLCSSALQLSDCPSIAPPSDVPQHSSPSDPPHTLHHATPTDHPQPVSASDHPHRAAPADHPHQASPGSMSPANHSYLVALNQSMFQHLEIVIPAAAFTLDMDQCVEILNEWNLTANVLIEVEHAQVSHEVANAAFGLTSQHVLPGLDRWSLVVQCAHQKNEANPEEDVDCDQTLMSVIATQFLNDVKATQTGLCSSMLQLPDCPSGQLSDPDVLVDVLMEETTALAADDADLTNLQQSMDSLASDAENAAKNNDNARQYVANNKGVLADIEWAPSAAVDKVVTGCGEWVADDGDSGAAAVAEDICEVDPTVIYGCMTAGTALLAVAAVGFVGTVLHINGLYPDATRDSGDEHKLDGDLIEAGNCEGEVVADMSNLHLYSQILFQNPESRAHTANTIKTSVAQVSNHVTCMTDDLKDIATVGAALVAVDRTNAQNYADCWVLCGDPPVAVVPDNLQDMTSNMQQQLMDFGDSIDITTDCCNRATDPDPDNACDNRVLSGYVQRVQDQFAPIDLSWRQYNQALCAYHNWTPCSHQVVLAGHRKLWNQRYEYAPPRDGLVPMGCAAFLAAALTVYWMMGRSKARKSVNAGGLEPLLQA